jgi:hypothetical protein
MTGSTDTQFTATGPATIGFQTQPPETNTQFEIGVDGSGLSIGVKGTGTLGERSPPRPDSGGTGVQGNGTGVGSGVAGFGGNATPGTITVDPSACAGVVGGGGLGPKSGGPGVAGFGGPNSGIGVFGQGGGPASGQPGGPGVKGIGGSGSASDNADGVQGFGIGTFSGVAGFGGGNSGTGAFGFGGGPGGPGVRGIGAGGPNTDPSGPVGVYGQGGPQSPGVVGQAGSAPADGVQGFGSGANSGVAGFGGDNSGTGVFGFGGGPGGPGVRGFGSGATPLTVPSNPVGVYGQGGPNGDGVQGVGTVGVHGIAGGNALDIGVLAEAGPNAFAAFHAMSSAVGEGGIAAVFDGDVQVNPSANLLTGQIAAFGELFVTDHDLTVLNGNLSVTGIKSAVVPFPDGSHRRLYCLESPENWFEDFGSGELTDGRAQIQLDPDFATTINTDAYHVFIAEYDDNNGLFVTNRTRTGFEVRAKTSAREAAFSYRVVARRKDIAPARLAKVTLPTASLDEIKARLAKAD